MLIEDKNCYILVKKYSSFRALLGYYQAYCVGRPGSERADYLQGFYGLKENVNDLFNILGNETLPDQITKPVFNLLKNIQFVVQKRLLTLEDVGKIYSVISEFLSKEEDNFKRKYFDYVVSRLSEKKYSKELYEAVAPLLESSKYDAAVAAAFKYLDSHLQKLLNISSYETYGEDLINRAFSPNSGALQLGTHPTEQVGLRNFFSGANALFRNPSAHRFVEYNRFDAEAIIATVAVMAHLATAIKEDST